MEAHHLLLLFALAHAGRQGGRTAKSRASSFLPSTTPSTAIKNRQGDIIHSASGSSCVVKGSYCQVCSKVLCTK